LLFLAIAVVTWQSERRGRRHFQGVGAPTAEIARAVESLDEILRVVGDVDGVTDVLDVREIAGV
jgi:hypothetical protein